MKKLDDLNLDKSPKKDWMGLVEDALGFEGLDDLDDDEPFNPMGKFVDEKPAPTKVLSDQEVLTDHGESPGPKMSSKLLIRYDPHEPHSA